MLNITIRIMWKLSRRYFFINIRSPRFFFLSLSSRKQIIRLICTLWRRLSSRYLYDGNVWPVWRKSPWNSSQSLFSVKTTRRRGGLKDVIRVQLAGWIAPLICLWNADIVQVSLLHVWQITGNSRLQIGEKIYGFQSLITKRSFSFVIYLCYAIQEFKRGG